jgi:hypothetical protein
MCVKPMVTVVDPIPPVKYTGTYPIKMLDKNRTGQNYATDRENACKLTAREKATASGRGRGDVEVQ